MTWIRFDESDHRVPAPSFCLPAVKQGRASGLVCLETYREDCNLALFFPQPGDGEDWIEALEAFTNRMEDYYLQEAQFLAILPLQVEEIRVNRRLARLPFPLLSDPERLVRGVYAGLMAESLVAESDSLLFVLDRYNAPYAALVVGKGKGEENFTGEHIQDDILKWFEYIGVQCPE